MGIVRHPDAAYARSRKHFPASWHAILSLLMKPYWPTLSVLLALTSTVAAQNFLLNPSFEEPVVPTGSYQTFSAGQTIGVGWIVDSTAIQTVVVDRDYTGGGVVWAPPTDGRQYLYVGNNASAATIHQDFPLVTPGAYRVTFDLANYLSNLFDIGAGVTIDVVTIGGNSSVIGGAQGFFRPPASGYATQSLDFFASDAGTYRLIVSNLEGSGSNVDNFGVFAAVPEPSSYAICAGAGMLGFALLRRLQRL